MMHQPFTQAPIDLPSDLLRSSAHLGDCANALDGVKPISSVCLAELDVQIALLEVERNIIQKKLNSVTYPILKLPVEVTCEIFCNCVPDLQDSHPIFDFIPERLPIPVLLTQICRVWRDIAFKTPKIWATFSLRVDELWGQDHTDRFHRLREWLEKARSVPLSFVLERRDVDRSSDTCPPLLRPILALADQWQNVHLHVPFEELVKKQFHSDLHGRLHSLEKLRITESLDGGTDVVAAFELAPSLRSVVLERLSAIMILLPWRQLTHFSGTWICGADCLHVLRSANSLVECKFDCVVRGRAMDETTLLPNNSTLEVLQLHGEAVCCDILSLLTLPSLVELDYHGDGVSDDHEDFIDFLSRSRPPLSRLFLHGGSYSLVLHGFSLLLGLTVLEISSLAVSKLSQFFQDLRTVSFLPNLESIAVTVYQPLQSYYILPEDTSNINYGDLTDALEFRRNRNGASSRLKTFRMKWRHEEWMHGNNREHDERMNELLLLPSVNFRVNLPRLQDLTEEGMHISVVAEVGNKAAAWI